MITKRYRNRSLGRGFTLIELMIVMAIIGTLAAIMTPVMLRARLKSYHVACTQNVRNLATALEAYIVDSRGPYPETLSKLVEGEKPYIQSLPLCPSNQEGYESGYTLSADHKEYEISCHGEHYKQLDGLVDQGYPKVINGQLYPSHPPATP